MNSEKVQITVDIPKLHYDKLQEYVGYGHIDSVEHAIQAGIEMIMEACRRKRLITLDKDKTMKEYKKENKKFPVKIMV